MSIAIDRFAAKGFFPTYSPLNELPRVSMFYVQCRSCGFEPEADRSPKVCPKCGCTGWERFTRPGSLLANAVRT